MMKKYFIIVVLLIIVVPLTAQKLSIWAFPVTDYIIDADSVTIVQVKLPKGLVIKEKTLGLVRSGFNKPGDSVITVGSGRCRMIKEGYFYFALLKKYLARKPVAGDLLYADITTPEFYSYRIFGAIRHNIIIKSIQDDTIADIIKVLHLKTREDEMQLLTKLKNEVIFTGKVMSEENNNQNMLITEGKFKNQKLFAAMQSISEDDVINFLNYIDVKPEKYAGHTWKFSEIMATWIVGGAPTVN